MKVKELVQRLSKEDQDCEVVLASDEEGNGFMVLQGLEAAKWSDGEVYSDDDDEAPVKCAPVIVLWP